MIIEPVTLAEAKTQCRVEFNADDDLIQSYITAAREYCEDFLNVKLAYDEETEEQTEIKTTWKQAILLIVADWYQHRENAISTAINKIPLGADQLLWQNRDIPV